MMFRPLLYSKWRHADAQTVRQYLTIVATFVICSLLAPEPARAQPLRLLVFGDSLTSGFNLPQGTAFPDVLARRLHADGFHDVLVYNGSVAGETTSEALQRLPSALRYGADLVIVELGGNDMLDGTDPRLVYSNLDQIISINRATGARVILAGMLALPKFGRAYDTAFDRIYPSLAARHKVLLDPFILSGVYGDRRLMQSDGEHPNAFGVQRMVAGILPLVEKDLSSQRNLNTHASR